MRSDRMDTGLKFAVIALLVLPQGALAYVGPGAGLTAIGTVLALFVALLLTLVGFVWYPVKRLMRNRRRPQEESAHTGGGPSDAERTGSEPSA